jgi:hypothetical protein
VASAPSRFGAGGRFFHPLGDEREPSARAAGSEQNSLGRCPRRTLERSVSELQREKWLAVGNLADAEAPSSPDEHDFERLPRAFELARPRARPVCERRLKPQRRAKPPKLRLHRPHRPPPWKGAWYRRNAASVATLRSGVARKLPHLYLMRSATLEAGSPSAATRSKKPAPRRRSISLRRSIIHGARSPLASSSISTSRASTMSARSSRA